MNAAHKLPALALGAGLLATEPFPHRVFEPGTILPPEVVHRLHETFPQEMLRGSRRRTEGGNKTYYVDHLTIFDRSRWLVPLTTLPQPWQGLMAALTSSEYARAMASLLELDVPDLELEVRLSSYPAGGWMSRHTDRPDKLFSQNLYLCPEWNASWGGGLALYRSEHDTEPSRVVSPAAGNSVAFARSDVSWHEVMAVAEDAEQPRRAVLVHGYRSSQEERELVLEAKVDVTT